MNSFKKLLTTTILGSGMYLLYGFSSSENPITYSNQSLATSDSTKKEYYLEMKGNVRKSKISDKEESKSLDSALITIYMNEIPFSETWTNKKGKCAFKLPLGKKFKIEVSKLGYVSKLFEVETNVPSDKKDEYSFSFDIDIFEEIKNLDVSVLKKPIAKVSYNIIMEQFAYDINYTSRINLELKKMYKSYYLLQKMENDSIDTNSKKLPTPPKK
jgi:hypothetical protein